MSTSRAPPTAAEPEAGFTLIEVLVALIIFGLVFGAVAGVIATGFRQTEAAARVVEETLLARSVLARVGTEIPLAAGRTEGSLDERFDYVVEITPTDFVDEEFEIAALRVAVSVHPADQGPEAGVDLVTLRLGPAPP